MYEVTVVIKPSNPTKPERSYAKAIYKGVYMPKEGKTPTAKIKQQVQQFLEPYFQKNNTGLNLKFVSINVKKMKDDFFIVEDKLE